MEPDEKLDARQKIAKQLDMLLNKSTSPVTTEGFKSQAGGSPDFSTADLSDAQLEKYITRKKRGLLAEEIKGADDPLGYVGGLEGTGVMDELPGGVTRQQAERLAKLTKARRAGEQAAAKAARMAEPKRNIRRANRGKDRGFTGLGKGTPLTTPGQKMRRAARLAERKGNIGRANQLFQEARVIDPESTAFFKSPMEREAAKSAQKDVIVGLAKKRAEEAR